MQLSSSGAQLLNSSSKIFENGNECTHFRHYKKKSHARNKTCRKYSTAKNTTTTSTSTGARDLYSFPREFAERDVIECSHRRGNARARGEIFSFFRTRLKNSFWSRSVFENFQERCPERERCSRTREGNETDEKREATTRSFFSFARVSGFLRGKRGCFFIAFCPSLSHVFVKRIADENNFSLSLSFLSRTDTWCYRRISPSACRRTDYCRRCVAFCRLSSRRRDAAILFSLSLRSFFSPRCVLSFENRARERVMCV